MEAAVETGSSFPAPAQPRSYSKRAKTILAERGKRFSDHPTFPNPLKETFKVLQLVPDGILDAA
jgi:hypothetical protein